MKAKNLLLFSAACLLWWSACTPKIAEPAPQEPVPQPAPPPPDQAQLSPCPKFSDAPSPDEISDQYVIYRDFLRLNDYERAFPLWQRVYAIAPAADGLRNTVYSDGIRFYEHFIAQTEDSLLREAYIDTIFQIYDEIDRCYPQGGYIAGLKAFDYYYKYPHRATPEETYALFVQSIETDSIDAQDFILNPFSALLTDLFDAGKISRDEAYKYQKMILQVIEKGLKECKGAACERWEIIAGYAPERLRYFETVEGFYDCEYYMDKYYEEFLLNQEDCDVVRMVYSRLKWGGCAESEERFRELIRIGNQNCRPEPGPAEMAYILLKEAKYRESIEAFEKAIEQEADVVKKANHALTIAKIYNAHLRNFPRARQWAQRAAEIRGGWGEPYLLIGRLYASSGPLCGPGTGWDSQIVTWPAIDMWVRAKTVDPSTTAEANKWINQYSRYMPTREDIFFRSLSAGDRFFVPCWIQEWTTIRTSD
jgi:tetratricopeptide (TPR) repeat protein